MDRYNARSGQIDSKLDGIRAQIEEQHAIRAKPGAAFEQHDAAPVDMRARFEDSQQVFEALEVRLSDARNTLRDQERGAQEAHFAERSLQDRIAGLRRNIQVASDQAQQIVLTLENACAELETINEQTAYTGL